MLIGFTKRNVVGTGRTPCPVMDKTTTGGERGT